MYGRILLSVVLPFFLIAAGFEYALEVRQGSDLGNIATQGRQSAGPHLSPAVVTAKGGRSRVSGALSPSASEADLQPVLLDPQLANDYPPGGEAGRSVNVITSPAHLRPANEWSEVVSAAKPADLIASEDDMNLLVVSAAELRPLHVNLLLPAVPARPSAAAVPLKADQTSTVPEPATALLLAAGACVLRKRHRRP